MPWFLVGILFHLLFLTGCNLRVPQPEQQSILLTTVADVTSTPLIFPTPASAPVITFPPTVVEHLHAIYAAGQALGNHPDVFVKVGDSITVSANFLNPIGQNSYFLGDYASLQAVIDFFSVTPARTGSSFSNNSLAAGVGWAAFAAISPSYADPTHCAPGETPLACEYRLNKPSIALIMYGTNDVGYRDVQDYRNDLEQIITVSERMGVIPVLSTIPNRPDMPSRVQQFNQIVADLTATHQLPLWDYYAATINLPDYGLTTDQVHPSSSPRSQADFSADNLRYGYVLRNLTALQMLDSVWKQIR